MILLLVDPNLTIGDEFVYNNTKHLVKNALKIYNYHSTGIGVVQSNGLRADAVAPYLWQIQTHTRCEGDFASEQGDWLVNDGLLSGSNRKNWGYYNRSNVQFL